MAAKRLKIGDHVTWNSEAGRVRGKIIEVMTSPVEFKGYACMRALANRNTRSGVMPAITSPCTKDRRLERLWTDQIGDEVLGLAGPRFAKGRRTRHADAGFFDKLSCAISRRTSPSTSRGMAHFSHPKRNININATTKVRYFLGCTRNPGHTAFRSHVSDSRQARRE